MSIALAQNFGRFSEAVYKIAGIISSGADWSETLTLSDSGAAISGATGWIWRLTLRSELDSDVIELTATTADSTLTVTNGSTTTSIAIAVPDTTLSSLLARDYIADLVSNNSGTQKLWGRGVVTLTHQPTW